MIWYCELNTVESQKNWGEAPICPQGLGKNSGFASIVF